MSSYIYDNVRLFDILTTSASWFRSTRNYLVVGIDETDRLLLLVEMTSTVEPDTKLNSFTIVAKEEYRGLRVNNFFWVEEKDLNQYTFRREGHGIVHLNQVSLKIDDQIYASNSSNWESDVAKALVNVRDGRVDCQQCYTKERVIVISNLPNAITFRKNGTVYSRNKINEDGQGVFTPYEPTLFERVSRQYDPQWMYYWSKGDPLFTTRRLGASVPSPVARRAVAIPLPPSPTPSAPPMEYDTQLLDCQRQNAELRDILNAMDAERAAAQRAAYEQQEQDERYARQLAREETQRAQQRQSDAETARQVQTRAAAPPRVQFATDRKKQLSLIKERMRR
jgi:hypothetical protein